jgi:fucose permease
VYPAALAAVVLLSAGWSLLINVGNVLIPIAFAGESLAYSFNLGNVFFGLGAFLTPLAVALFLRHATLPLALGVLAGLSVVPAALALGVDFLVPGLRLAPPAETAVTWGALLADPILWLSGLALFFYGPLEASMGAWATTYLSDQGVSEGTASTMLSAFWLVYMGTRLTTALTLPQGHERTLILVLSLAAVLVLLAMVLSRNCVLAMALVIAAGLVFGPIFPTTMGVLLGHFHASVHGRAVGMFFAIGGVGWTMIPLLIGAHARRTSVQRGFWVAVAAAVGLSLVAAILYKAAL